MPYTTEKFAKSSALARKKTGLLLGPVFFAILLALPTPEGMSATGMSVAAVVALMATGKPLLRSYKVDYYFQLVDA